MKGKFRWSLVNGPAFLWKMGALLSSKGDGVGSLESNVELKKEVRANPVQISDNICADIETKVSS